MSKVPVIEAGTSNEAAEVMLLDALKTQRAELNRTIGLLAALGVEVEVNASHKEQAMGQRAARVLVDISAKKVLL